MRDEQMTLNDSAVLRLVQIALAEDVGTGDITCDATLDATATGRAELLMKSDGVVAGTLIAGIVFGQVDREITCDWRATEGMEVTAGTLLGVVHGPLAGILTAERTALNFMQRMSGVATETRRYVRAVEGTAATIIDTRKTIPGWRRLDKYAVTVGGGENHRMGLYDMVMIKDNHVDACGSIAAAVRRTRERLDEWGRTDVAIEVETRSLHEVSEALSCEGVTRIMFDNFPLQLLEEAVVLVGDRCETEASGGVTLETVRPIAETGVRYISVGALTHSVQAADISLDLLPLV